MYSYEHDSRTGGLLLTASPTLMSREPRPVYAQELTAIGCERYFTFDETLDVPYMWAENTEYFYRGTKVGRVTRARALETPQFEPSLNEDGSVIVVEPNNVLRPVDIAGMLDANIEMLELLSMATVRQMIKTYGRYKKKVDCFHVAFSGGKDSWVVLDLALKTLPPDNMIVVFGDTGMEYPDTYESVSLAQQMCNDRGVVFRTAYSQFEPYDSWMTFGPPSRTLRWCCSVHKSAPQIMEIRRILNKRDYVGMDLVGVRKHESARRAEYEAVNFGKKIKDQYDFYPILEWTSAEVFLYMYWTGLPLNAAYKKGLSRVGCLVCPQCAGMGESMRNYNYAEETRRYHDIIRQNSDKEFTDAQFTQFINKDGWKTRGDGRFVRGITQRFRENCRKNGLTEFQIDCLPSTFREWMKTLDWDGRIDIRRTATGYSVTVSTDDLRLAPRKAKILRQVLRKAAYCVACGVCEANCRHGAIASADGSIRIEQCCHCGQCHDLPGGCLLYDSLKLPTGKGKMKSINSFGDHAPKPEWLEDFFLMQSSFLAENKLGPEQLVKFKRFLRDAELLEQDEISQTAILLSAAGWKSSTSLAIILTNLVANNPQFEWYVRNMELGRKYTRKDLEAMLMQIGCTERPARTIPKAYKRIVDTQLGTELNFGVVTDTYLVRTKCAPIAPEAVLYAMFRFAERCNGLYSITLTSLMSDDSHRTGVSPANVFGLDEAEMKNTVTGLSIKYPSFISSAFTYDLERINLAEDKKSQDVLALVALATSSSVVDCDPRY